MAGEKLSVDDLLAKQAVLRATVEAISGDETRVKITPFVPGAGCACSHSINLDKGAITELTATDEFHDCCGQRLPVVEVAFSDDRLADIFNQLSSSAADAAASRRKAGPRRIGGGGHTEWCLFEGQDCAMRCEPGDRCCVWDCHEWTQNCIDPDYRTKPCPPWWHGL